jgi:hypothetical protein
MFRELIRYVMGGVAGFAVTQNLFKETESGSLVWRPGA